MNFWEITNWTFGFFGIVLAIWAYVKSRQIKKVVIGHRSIDVCALIPESSLQPRFYFSGHQVEKAYFNYIYILNKGNKTVSADDLRSVFKIGMNASAPPKVLDWATLGSSRPSGVEIELIGDEATWEIHWSHLDPGQSITIEAYTDRFVDSISSDGNFSYELKVESSDREWSRRHALGYTLGILAVGLFTLREPLWEILSTGRMINLSSDKWDHLPLVLLTLVGFWMLIMIMSWFVGKLRPGPRSIANL